MTDPLLLTIQQWSTGHPLIQLALLVGSRAQAGAHIDAFSDYDITLFVTDVAKMLAKESDWLTHFGQALIRLPEEVQLEEHTYPSRLVLYKEGYKIDFILYNMIALQHILQGDHLPAWIGQGYHVLADQQSYTTTLAALPRQSSVHLLPSPTSYRATVEEFFWEITYIAKNLKREKLWPATYSFWVTREEILLPMLIWYAALRDQPPIAQPMSSRNIEAWLSPEMYTRLLQTYPTADLQQNSQALQQLIELFTEIARAVGHKLGYRYPVILEKQILQYIERPLY